MNVSFADRILGGIIGSAVGDALGAPTECLHYKDINRILGDYRGFKDLTEARLKAVLETRGWPCIAGKVTDDTVISDLLLDCIIANNGDVNAHTFAKEWEKMDKPVPNPDGDDVVRLNNVHFIERIPFYRNMLREIGKRELGHGEANATNAVMYIAPVGLLCAGDPLKAELMAVDVTAVNQHGRPRDVAGGYCAALAACFLPGMSVQDIIDIGVKHTRDEFRKREMDAMLKLASECGNCDEFIAKYYEEILGPIIPYQDMQSAGTSACVSWNSAEVLGVTLATFLITGGRDAREMMLACAKIGRDSDTICRVAGGLIGTWLGADSVPGDWREVVLAQNKWLRLEEKAAMLVGIAKKNLERRITAT